MSRAVPQQALDLIREFEGCRLEAYKCPAGVWTIGYGSTHGAREGDRWSQAEADERLEQDASVLCATICRDTNGHGLNDNQLSALISLAYNIGMGALKGSTLMRFIRRGDYESAADQFERWNKAGGKPLAGLTRRRKAERELFES